MKAAFKLILVLCLAGFAANAGAAAIVSESDDVDYNYQIKIRTDGIAEVHWRDAVVAGKIDYDKGIYKQWSFLMDEEFPANVYAVINDQTKAIIEQNVDDCGLRLLINSPSNKYVVTDNACSINENSFVIYDATGKTIFEDGYVDEEENIPYWIDDNRFAYLKLSEVNDPEAWRKNPEALRKCESVGGAADAGWVAYNIDKNTTEELADKPHEWVCIQ